MITYMAASFKVFYYYYYYYYIIIITIIIIIPVCYTLCWKRLNEMRYYQGSHVS